MDVSTLDAEELARLRLEKIGFVFQGFNLLSRMDALHNVMMPLGYADVPAVRARRSRARRAGGGGPGRAHRTIARARLSGGQQQRVAIARALINQPALICWPTSPPARSIRKTGEEILALFKRLRTRATPSC